MKKRLVSTVSLWAAAVAVLLVGSVARAQVKSSISIRYIPDIPCSCLTCPPVCPSDPCCITPTQAAGVDASNWNNVFGKGGVVHNLMRETDGKLDADRVATLVWEATNTSANPDGSINFKGSFDPSDPIGDRKLMTGYLDQNTSTPSPTFVQIINIPDDMALKYDVYIYTLTTVPSFGGTYAVNGGDPKYVLPGGNGVFNGPDFVEAIGDDPMFGERDWGNHVVFRGLSGTTVTITAINTPGGGKAPINGLQIVKSSF